ncbi:MULTISPECIES: hypothetical protein [unclassified Micromonospora]|uniref:hypothetical protein n=1 Tax=unclassified Micromonospora TaxID=2617518 RepID=UPI001C243626|nr:MULTISPECIES: hypothetical protein [unclassified Micromonospora]MBU8860287.1 hypothetical protein [Micromonospora sp. WMMB482]MDM4779821.1 hypothetical protein [Micromonospora sp. b486]
MPALLHSHEVSQLLELVQDQPGSTSVFLDLLGQIKDRVAAAIDADPLVAERLGGNRHRLIDIEFREEEQKVADAQVSVRLAEAVIYDYDRSVLIIAVLDLRAGVVEAIVERPGIQPALTAEERDEAYELVVADDRYEALRARGAVDMVALPARAAQIEDNPRFGHRLFQLYFWSRGDAPARVGQAAVDLSTREVVSTDEARATASGPQTQAPHN